MELIVRRAITSVQLRTILEENHHPFLIVEHNPMIYERTRDMEGHVAQIMKQASGEATILIYSLALDRHLKPWPSMPTGSFASMICRDLGEDWIEAPLKSWQAKPHGRPSHEVALVAQTEVQGAKSCRKSQAPGAGDSQGDPGLDLRRPALRCGGDDTAEAGGEELERRGSGGRRCSALENRCHSRGISDPADTSSKSMNV